MLLKVMALPLRFLCLAVFLSSSRFATVHGGMDDGDEQADAAFTHPRFTSKSGEHTVLAGRMAHLPCRATDLGDFAVSWFKVGPSVEGQTDENEQYNSDQQLFVDRTRITSDERLDIKQTENEDDYGLEIRAATAYDSGAYECHISTTPPLIQQQILKVTVPPSVSIDPDSNPYIVEPGHSMTLKCYSAGYPAPDVVWSRLGGPLPDGRAAYKHNQQAQLFYDTTTANHSGVYRCTADNDVGDPASAEIKVEVHSKGGSDHAPIVKIGRKFFPVKVGDTVALSCNYSAYPSPQVHWIFNSFAINSESNKWRERISMSFNKPLPDQDMLTTTLTIKDVQESDFGEYLCRVENNLGKSEITIDVSGKPGPPYPFTGATYEDRIDLSWRLESASDVLGYKLLYRKLNDDYSLSIDIPAKNGHRMAENEWMATYTWPLSSKGGLLKPDTEYQLSIQGVNQYGDGSLPNSPLVIRTPAKFLDHDGTHFKEGHAKDTETVVADGPGEASKSTKESDHNGAQRMSQINWTILCVFLPLIRLLLWNRSDAMTP